jgi:hypothetical protein
MPTYSTNKESVERQLMSTVELGNLRMALEQLLRRHNSNANYRNQKPAARVVDHGTLQVMGGALIHRGPH